MRQFDRPSLILVIVKGAIRNKFQWNSNRHFHSGKCNWKYLLQNNGHISLSLMRHCSGVIISTMASQITSVSIIYSAVYSDADQRKHRSSWSLAFVRGIHRYPVNSPYKGLLTGKMFPFDDVFIVTSSRGMILSKMEMSFARHEEGFQAPVPFQWGIM